MLDAHQRRTHINAGLASRTRINDAHASRPNTHQRRTRIKAGHAGRASGPDTHQGRTCINDALASRTRINDARASRPDTPDAHQHRTRINARRVSTPNMHQGRTPSRPIAIKAEHAPRPNLQGQTRINAERARPNVQRMRMAISSRRARGNGRLLRADSPIRDLSPVQI